MVAARWWGYKRRMDTARSPGESKLAVVMDRVLVKQRRHGGGGRVGVQLQPPHKSAQGKAQAT